MSLLQLTKLPFRKAGNKFIYDIGDIRLIVNDPSLLVADKISDINLLTGVRQSYDYYLQLPAFLKMVVVGS